MRRLLPLLLVVVTLTPWISRATTIKSEWVIRDARLRDKIVRSVDDFLLNAAHDTSEWHYLSTRANSAEVVVEAIDNREDNTRRIVALVIDSLRVGPTENVRIALGESLYDFVAARRSYEYDVSRTSGDELLCSTLWWPEVKIRASLSSQQVRIAPGFAIANEIGNSSILMPWWQYGMFRIGIAHSNFRFLVQGPFTPGIQRALFIAPRKIDGAFGGSFQFRVENWSGELSYATLSKRPTLYDAFANPQSLVYVSTVAQVRYSIFTSVGSIGSMQIGFGGGIHRIKRDSVGESPGFILHDPASEPPLIVSPVFEMTFISNTNDVELSGQFYHTSIELSGAIKIWGSLWLTGQALFIKPLRTPDAWEQESFFFLSPEFRL